MTESIRSFRISNMPPVAECADYAPGPAPGPAALPPVAAVLVAGIATGGEAR